MEYVLGIDIGTGSAKAVAVNLSSEPISVSQVHYATNSRRPGYSEQDPEVIWEAFKTCIHQTIEQLQETPTAISLSSAMHSLIPVDNLGNKLAEMMTWADGRSNDIAIGLKKSPQGKHIYEVSGMPLHAMSPLCKIIWLRENDPDIFNKADKFISIKEYIWFRLFDEFVVDESTACAYGMFDISQRKWSSDLLRLAGISEGKLSRPVSTRYTNRHKSALEILPRETVFVIGASDGCLANLGSHATQNGVAAITIGTSGAVRIASPVPILNDEAFTFSYILDEATFICGGPVNNGGNVLTWMIGEFLGETPDEQSYAAFFEAVSRVSAGADGLLFLPYLSGERAPLWDAKSSGAFIGLRANHTRDHFCRAALEGICFALNQVLIAVEQNSDPVTQINVSGGFVHSNVWMQMLADVTGKTLSLEQTEDASAMGAALLAMTTLKLGPGNSGAAGSNFIMSDLQKHQVYIKSFGIFKNLYPLLKDSMHELNPVNS